MIIDTPAKVSLPDCSELTRAISILMRIAGKERRGWKWKRLVSTSKEEERKKNAFFMLWLYGSCSPDPPRPVIFGHLKPAMIALFSRAIVCCVFVGVSLSLLYNSIPPRRRRRVEQRPALSLSLSLTLLLTRFVDVTDYFGMAGTRHAQQ